MTSVKQSGTSVKQPGTSDKQPEISTKHLVISPKVQKQQQLTFSSDKIPCNMVENPVISAQLSVTKDQYPVASVLHPVTSAIESGTLVENIVNTTGSTVQEKKTLNSDNPIHSSDELLELPNCEHPVITAQHPVSSARPKEASIKQVVTPVKPPVTSVPLQVSSDKRPMALGPVRQPVTTSKQQVNNPHQSNFSPQIPTCFSEWNMVPISNLAYSFPGNHIYYLVPDWFPLVHSVSSQLTSSKEYQHEVLSTNGVSLVD
jgi:hypothetical protein